MIRSKKFSTISVLAAMAAASVCSLAAPQAAQAQGYYQHASAQYQADVAHAALNPNDTTTGGTAPTPVDTTAYGAAFDQMKSNMQSVATGPVGLGALGLMVIGVIFSVVWRLIKKGGSAVGK